MTIDLTTLTLVVSLISLIASCVAITMTRTMWKMMLAELEDEQT